MNQTRRVCIMAAGTGGHIFPALAVARELQQHHVEVTWLGTAQGLEQQLVREAGIDLKVISMRGVRKKGIFQLFSAPLFLLKAIFESLHHLNQIRPDLVIGFGGFVTLPGGIAAFLKRIPVVVQEQNAIPGLSNKVLSKISKIVFQAFPNTFAKSNKVVTCGNPIRQQLLEIAEPKQRFASRAGELNLLVMGGSLGAKAFNEIIPEAVVKLAIKPNILHSAGKNVGNTTQQRYQSLGIVANVVEFISDMAAAYSWADLIICRAGALTVSELAAVGLGGILIPYPFAVDDHQSKNAKCLVEVGAAILLPQTQMSADRLATILAGLTREKLLAMAVAAKGLNFGDASKVITEACLGFD